jgi:sigma-B regulation protein RsbU (phosphoserine phosphatase)
MLLFTDGLIEAENEEQEIFGKDRLIQYIEGRKETRLGEGLLDAIRKWRGNAPINDDLTLLEIWREKI